MVHLTLTAVLLLAALAAYGAGIHSGVLALVLLGAALEAWCWVRALRRRPRPPAAAPGR